MRIIRMTDPLTWDRTLLTLPNPHILQSWAWGEFKARHGWRVTRLLFQEGDRTVAAASLLQRKLPGLPLTLGYIPKGPALDWGDTVLAARVLSELERLISREQAIFVKIDPDVYHPDQAPAFSPRPACAPNTARMLTARSWRFSDEQIQFRNTILLNLKHTDDELLSAMKPKFRYNIRLALRRGVAVRQGTPADLDLLYQLYLETSERDGFVIRAPEYYFDVWGSFLQADLAHLLLAEVEGKTVAGLVLFTFGATAWYMYGASSDRHRQHMPNHLLQWEAIRRAKAVGCTLYDLWGAPDQLDESHPMWGVVRFKLGLGGELAQGLGAWDFPIKQAAYRVYSVVMPRYLDWLHRK